MEVGVGVGVGVKVMVEDEQQSQSVEPCALANLYDMPAQLQQRKIQDSADFSHSGRTLKH